METKTSIDWSELAAEIADDGWNTYYRIYLGDGRSLYIEIDGCKETDSDSGYVSSAEISTDDMVHYLAGLDWDPDDSYERIAQAGFDPKPLMDTRTDAIYGTYRVWHDPCYYAGTYGAPAAHWARGEDGEILEFPLKEAQNYVAEYYSAPSEYDGVPACQVLSHGQAGPDNLTICHWR